MLKGPYTCGIDVGTNYTKVMVIRYDKDKKENSIVATGITETKGIRQGYIVNTDHVAESIKKAVDQAEKTLESKIHKAYVSIGGISLRSSVCSGSVITTRADQEISSLDVEKVISNSEDNLDVTNKKIIHTIPLGYKLDGKEIYVKPEGLKGQKLEVKTLFITCLKQNLEDLITAFGLAKVKVEDIVASPLITGNILLNNKQKVAGCVLVDIGAETLSTIVFENNVPIFLFVHPIGSLDITKDIALGLKISLEEAETIKMGNVIGGDYSKKKVDEIIEARLDDMFEIVDNDLKRIKRNELLPAGIILTGGGSGVNDIENIAKAQLKLPAKVGPSDFSAINKFKVRDNSWYTALSLALYASDEDYYDSSLKNNIKEARSFFKDIFSRFFSQLLP